MAMLPHLDFVNLLLSFPPRIDVLLRPVDVAFGVRNLSTRVSEI